MTRLAELLELRDRIDAEVRRLVAMGAPLPEGRYGAGAYSVPALVKAARTKDQVIREWARGMGYSIGTRGRIPHVIRSAYDLAHPRQRIGVRA